MGFGRRGGRVTEAEHEQNKVIITTCDSSVHRVVNSTKGPLQSFCSAGWSTLLKLLSLLSTE